MLSMVFSGNASAASLDSFAGLEGTISIAGGTAHIPVMNDAAKAIMTAHPKIRITVEGQAQESAFRKSARGWRISAIPDAPFHRRKSPSSASSPIPLPWTGWLS
jgi:ABC-type phosphate transport system substrate-binding protein